MRQSDTQIIMVTDLHGASRWSTAESTHDMVSLRNRSADIVALQGMKHLCHWASLRLVFCPDDWDHYPHKPLQSGWGQPIVWRRRDWSFVREFQCEQSDTLVAVLLQHEKTGLRVWVRNTEYSEDNPEWATHNERDQYCLQKLATTGYPVLSVGNYHRYEQQVLGTKIGDREIRYVGTNESEYVMMLNGLGTQIMLQHQDVVPDFRLFGKTSARMVAYRLRGMDREDADV